MTSQIRLLIIFQTNGLYSGASSALKFDRKIGRYWRVFNTI